MIDQPNATFISVLRNFNVRMLWIDQNTLQILFLRWSFRVVIPGNSLWLMVRITSNIS